MGELGGAHYYSLSSFSASKHSGKIELKTKISKKFIDDKIVDFETGNKNSFHFKSSKRLSGKPKKC